VTAPDQRRLPRRAVAFDEGGFERPLSFGDFSLIAFPEKRNKASIVSSLSGTNPVLPEPVECLANYCFAPR
jgi:hypothetical protein